MMIHLILAFALYLPSPSSQIQFLASQSKVLTSTLDAFTFYNPLNKNILVGAAGHLSEGNFSSFSIPFEERPIVIRYSGKGNVVFQLNESAVVLNMKTKRSQLLPGVRAAWWAGEALHTVVNEATSGIGRTSIDRSTTGINVVRETFVDRIFAISSSGKFALTEMRAQDKSQSQLQVGLISLARKGRRRSLLGVLPRRYERISNAFVESSLDDKLIVCGIGGKQQDIIYPFCYRSGKVRELFDVRNDVLVNAPMRIGQTQLVGLVRRIGELSGSNTGGFRVALLGPSKVKDREFSGLGVYGAADCRQKRFGVLLERNGQWFVDSHIVKFVR